MAADNKQAIAKIRAWAKKSQDRMQAIFQQSTTNLIYEAQTVINEGGSMPIDTGFLRNSFNVSLSGLPSGPLRPTAGETAKEWQPAEVELTIAGAPLGATIFGGWTAAYAMRMEYGFQGKDSLGRVYSQTGYGFLRKSVQNWQSIVDKVTDEAKRRFP